MLIDRSDDEVLELGAISNSLSAEDVSEDGNNEVIGVVFWALDDSVSKDKFNSDILEAVAGQEEGNTVPFDNISENGLRLFGIALVKHFLSLFHKSEDFNLEWKIFLLKLWKNYSLKISELGIDFWLDEVEDFSDTVVLSGECFVFLNWVDCQEEDEKAWENDDLHCKNILLVKSIDFYWVLIPFI